jgi:hypothetical protein
MKERASAATGHFIEGIKGELYGLKKVSFTHVCR